MFERLKSINPLVWITLLAAIFRFAELGSVRLTYDLAWQAWDATRIINGIFPIIGQPTPSFLDNPPLMGYIQAIPLFFWRSPWSVFITISLINSFAIPFVFAALDHTLGRRIAIISSILFAINPWIVHYSRMTWAHGLIPFFLAVMAWGWWPIFCSDRTRWLTFQTWELISSDSSIGMVSDRLRFVAGWLALIAMVQTSILALIMIVPTFLLMIAFWRKLPYREVQIGLSVLIFSLLFYTFTAWLNLEQGSTKFVDLSNEIGALYENVDLITGDSPSVNLTGDLTANVNNDAFVKAMLFVTGRGYVGQDVDGPETVEPLISPFLLQVSIWLFSGAFIVGLIILFVQRRPMTWILTIWFFVPIGMIMLLPAGATIHPHYLLFTLPAGGIIAAVGLDWAMSQHKAIYWSLVVCLLLVGFQFKASMWQSARLISRQPKNLGLAGLPLREAGRVGRQIRSEHDNDNRPVPVRMVADGNDQLLTAISGVLIDVAEGLDPLGFPDEYVFSQKDQSTIYVTYYQRSDAILVSSISDFELAAGLIENRVEYETESGLTFLGYSTEIRDDDSIEIRTFWRFDALQDMRNEWFVAPTINLVGTGGQLMNSQTLHGQNADLWQLGDIYASNTTLDLPTDTVELELVLVDINSDQQFSMLTPEGHVTYYQIDLE